VLVQVVARLTLILEYKAEGDLLDNLQPAGQAVMAEYLSSAALVEAVQCLHQQLQLQVQMLLVEVQVEAQVVWDLAVVVQAAEALQGMEKKSSPLFLPLILMASARAVRVEMQAQAALLAVRVQMESSSSKSTTANPTQRTERGHQK
jgi:predicted amino acid-binding ACT domain protein